jgi:asparagine synthase (glutamine-hydrolysing)
MSAIAGILNLDGRPVQQASIETMMDSLAHRGRDGRGLWIEGSVGLGHQALWTTPEASLESLPMQLDGRVAITGDVRLDNREDLLRALPRSGFLSESAPDCALVMAAYEKWGEDCVEQLLGDFAFAIWDKRARKLFCARDHMGIKPFYYAVIPGRLFAFATEIKAVLSVPGVAETVNEQKVADAFVHLINDPFSTYYLQVSRLPAAHCLAATRDVSTRRYWKLNPDRELRLNSDQEYADGFHEVFSRAVHCRLRSSHPIGSMLSGGLDSSSITCVARDWLKAQGKPKLHTFSAVFDEVSECDERPYIQTVLDQGHCEPNFIVLDSLSPLSDAEAIMERLDEPVWAFNMYLGWNAFRKAQELGVRAILDGFDGDTTVSHGAGRMIELARSRRWLDLAVELRGGSRNFGGNFWLDNWWRWIWKYHPAAQRANRLWSGAMRRVRSSRSSKPSAAPAWNPIDLLNPELARRWDFREISQRPAPPFKDERNRHCRLIEREILTKSVEMLAHTSASFDVEVRFPFMDVRLIEYCLSLPSDQKMRRGYTRVVLRHGMAKHLPAKIRWRGGKSNLGPSFEKGLLKFERENLGNIILGEADQLESYVNMKRIKECLDRFRRGEAMEHEVSGLWRTAGLALWLRHRRGENELFMLQRKEVN